LSLLVTREKILVSCFLRTNDFLLIHCGLKKVLIKKFGAPNFPCVARSATDQPLPLSLLNLVVLILWSLALDTDVLSAGTYHYS
jgi:hypothetical protein